MTQSQSQPTTIDPGIVAAAQQAIMKHPHYREGGSVTAFGYANVALEAVGYAALKSRITELEAWQRASLETRDMDRDEIAALKANECKAAEHIRGLEEAQKMMLAIAVDCRGAAEEYARMNGVRDTDAVADIYERIAATIEAAAFSHAGPVARDGERDAQ